MKRIALYNDSFQNWKSHDIGSGTTLIAAGNLGRKAYGFELKKEFVKGFEEKILPLMKEDMFVQAEREEKKFKQLEMFGS